MLLTHAPHRYLPAFCMLISLKRLIFKPSLEISMIFVCVCVSVHVCHSRIPWFWEEIIIEPDDTEHSTRVLKMLFWPYLSKDCLAHYLLCACISFLKTGRFAFWHAQTLFPTSCYSWHDWNHPGGQNFSFLVFVLSWLYFIVLDGQSEKLNRPLLSRGTGDNESLKEVFAKSFFFRIFPSVTELVALGWWMSYGPSYRQEITWKLSSKASNYRSCPVNKRMMAMTTAGYLEHLSVWFLHDNNCRFIWTWCHSCKCTNSTSTIPVSSVA